MANICAASRETDPEYDIEQHKVQTIDNVFPPVKFH